MGKIDPLAVEHGEGYWCYRVAKPTEPKIAVGMADGNDLMDEPCFDTQLVYRPVRVGVNDKGRVYAYYYDAEMDFEEMLKTDGKRFVPPEQVHATPLPNAEPAYKHK